MLCIFIKSFNNYYDNIKALEKNIGSHEGNKILSSRDNINTNLDSYFNREFIPVNKSLWGQQKNL